MRMADVLPPEQPSPEELAAQQRSEAPDASEMNPGQAGQMPAGDAAAAQAAMQGGPPPGQMPPQAGGQMPPQAEGQMPPQGGGPPQQGGIDSTVTPELQDQYDRVMLAAGTILFKDAASHAQIIRTLKAGAKEPAKTIATIAVNIVTQLDERSGRKLPPEIIIPVGAEVTEQLCDLAKAAGVFPVDAKVMGQAGQAMIVEMADRYGVDAAEVNALLNQFTPSEQEAMRAQQHEIASNGEPGAQQPPQGAMGMGQAMPPQQGVMPA